MHDSLQMTDSANFLCRTMVTHKQMLLHSSKGCFTDCRSGMHPLDQSVSHLQWRYFASQLFQHQWGMRSSAISL